MSTVPRDVMTFDVERGLAKALAIRCETFLVDTKASTYKIRIGSRWNLVLTGEQLEGLWDHTDNPQSLRDAFDAIKAECLGFQSVHH